MEKQPAAATCHIWTRLSFLHPTSWGGLPWVCLLRAGNQGLLGVGGLSGWCLQGLVILRMMSWGCGLRTAGSHLPFFEKISGVGGVDHGDHRHKAESQVQSFHLCKTKPSSTNWEPENDQLRDYAHIISPSALAPRINLSLRVVSRPHNAIYK